MLCSCIANTHEIMCGVALDSLTHLVIETGSKYTEEMWETLIKSFTDLFLNTVPNELVAEAVELEDLEQGSPQKLPFNPEECMCKC